MPQTSICLICLVGLPASGKTTFAHNFKARYKRRYNVDIISFDIEISQDCNISWKDKRSAVHCSVILLIQKYLTSSDKQTLIVLDDNMFYKSMRYEYFQLARKYSLGFCEIYLSSPLEMCLKLNRQRATNQVKENTIIKMNELLEVPDSSVNNWETNIVILTNQSLSPDDWLNVENTLHNCLLTPVKDFPRLHKEDLPQSILHLADIALRKIVNVLIIKRKETYGVSKLYNLELLKKRQQILNNVRAGEIVLPKTHEENCIVLYSEHLQQYF